MKSNYLIKVSEGRYRRAKSNEIKIITSNTDGTDEKPVPTIQVVSPSAGIGDHILSLTISEGYRQKFLGCKVLFAAAEWVHPWLELFGGYDELIVPDSVNAPIAVCDNSGDYHTFTSVGKPRWQFWGEKFDVIPTVPSVKPVPRVAEEFVLPYSHSIVLSPFAAYPERTWSLINWLDLERLLNSAGFKVILLDGVYGRLQRFKVEGKLQGEAPDKVIAAIRGSLCFVGNDSGMCHIAGASSIPAIAITFASSDKNIMDIWPTVTTLENKSVNKITPEDVMQEILTKVWSNINPSFPKESFLSALRQEDFYRRHCWLNIYSILWELIKGLAPQRIVEIGTRSGTSAWTMLQAIPTASIHTIDLPVTQNDVHSKEITHARQLLANRAVTFQVADSLALEHIPECDLCYIDGDHSEEVCYADCCLAERSGAKVILLDDYCIEGIRKAANRFLQENKHRKGRFIPSQTGFYLIESINV